MIIKNRYSPKSPQWTRRAKRNESSTWYTQTIKPASDKRPTIAQESRAMPLLMYHKTTTQQPRFLASRAERGKETCNDTLLVLYIEESHRQRPSITHIWPYLHTPLPGKRLFSRVGGNKKKEKSRDAMASYRAGTHIIVVPFFFGFSSDAVRGRLYVMGDPASRASGIMGWLA